MDARQAQQWRRMLRALLVSCEFTLFIAGAGLGWFIAGRFF